DLTTVNSLTGDVSNLSSEVTQQADLISQKVDSTVFNTKTGQLEKDITAVEQTATGIDRKSTRLNSSHVSISYAVFCLKKKHNQEEDRHKVFLCDQLSKKTAHIPSHIN